MSDPLNDPRFPNRPQHPDYWRLSETALLLDGQANEGGKTVAEIVAGLVDVTSLEYVCQQRAELMVQGLGLKLPDSIKVLIAGAILGGIAHGILFEQHGGHVSP